MQLPPRAWCWACRGEAQTPGPGLLARVRLFANLSACPLLSYKVLSHSPIHVSLLAVAGCCEQQVCEAQGARPHSVTPSSRGGARRP